jgi:hypothetical protein
MLVGDNRRTLAGLQEGLVRALTDGNSCPPGFDEERVQLAARSLVRKRIGALARAWPALRRALGESFEEVALAYVTKNPLPQEGGPLADGRAFIRALAQVNRLPDEVRVEAFVVDLRYLSRPCGLVPRRGITIKGLLLQDRFGFVIGVRLPWLGERWFAI